MSDPFAAALGAVATRSATAPVLVFFAGVLSSVGPCTAPRALAACAIAQAPNLALRTVKITAFMLGLISTYACFGVSAALLGKLSALSTPIYFIVATVLFFGGLWTLCGADERAAHEHARAGRFGAPFFLGASFALVISPCCTPLVVAILGYTSNVSDPLYGAGLLAVFAIGHSLPVLAYAAGFARGASLLGALNWRPVVSVVSGSLMLALAAYYLVLA